MSPSDSVVPTSAHPSDGAAHEALLAAAASKAALRVAGVHALGRTATPPAAQDGGPSGEGAPGAADPQPGAGSGDGVRVSVAGDAAVITIDLVVEHPVRLQVVAAAVRTAVARAAARLGTAVVRVDVEVADLVVPEGTSLATRSPRSARVADPA